MINLNNLIESVSNPNGRFRSLGEIYPATDGGELCFRSGHSYCDIEMVLYKHPVIMRCYLDKDKQRNDRLKSVSAFLSAIDEPVYNRFSYHEAELLVFDDSGGYEYIDVSIEEKVVTVPFMAYCGKCLCGNPEQSEKSVKSILRDLSAFSLRHVNHRLYTGGISHNRIYINETGILLAGLGASSRADCENEAVDLAFLFCVLYLAYSDKSLLLHLSEDTFCDLCSAGPQEEYKITWSNIFSKAVTTSGCPEPLKRLCNTLKSLLGSELIGMGVIEGILSDMRELSRGDIYRCGKLAGIPDLKLREESGNRAPQVKFEFVGDMQGMLMRAYDGKGWCYIDKDSKVSIAGPFLSASDFTEGLAVVETADGTGVIDVDGNFVLNPLYDDVELDISANRLIVTLDGISGILSRTGEKITEIEYDHILSEREGYYLVKKDGKYGYLDFYGEPATDIIYDDASCFSNGIAQVVFKGRTLYIGTDGKEITNNG